ncbi:MAG: nuclear transport factor 2 family protein [Solirubrobacterales bacterium]
MAEIDWERRLREGIEAYNRGDWEAVLTDASDDIELQRADISPEARDIVRGRERVLEYFRPEVFEDQRIDLREIEIGDGAVYMSMRFSARGAGSGIPVEIDSYAVYRIADDLLTRLEIYADEPEARAAAGLTSPP